MASEVGRGGRWILSEAWGTLPKKPQKAPKRYFAENRKCLLEASKISPQDLVPRAMYPLPSLATSLAHLPPSNCFPFCISHFTTGPLLLLGAFPSDP